MIRGIAIRSHVTGPSESLRITVFVRVIELDRLQNIGFMALAHFEFNEPYYGTFASVLPFSSMVCQVAGPASDVPLLVLVET